VKVVVVGASSGLGRCIAIGLARRGEKVAALARRKEMLDAAAAEAGGGTVAIRCDVTDESSCKAAMTQAAEILGGIDGFVYTPAIGPLARLAETDAETWRKTFDTNVIGASSITAAALPYLNESRGVASYLSSVSASFTAPWPGLGAYAVSKAALDKLVDAWRTEHPQIGFTRVTVGDCVGGEGDSMSQFVFVSGWDLDFAGEMIPAWSSQKLLSGSLLDVENLVNVLHQVLSCGSDACIPSVTVVPRPVG
jgi:NAD(P)-dependent dehydrogenase (short-subunit alcohol dehydrogenase family)